MSLAEIFNLCSYFGVVAKLIKLQTKTKALVEFINTFEAENCFNALNGCVLHN